MHGRANRAPLACPRLADGPAGDVGVNLHQQLVALRQPARGHDLLDRYAVGLEVIDDDARAIGGGLDQGSVDFLRPGCQRQAQQQTGQVDIHQDRAVAIPPVESQQTALTRL